MIQKIVCAVVITIAVAILAAFWVADANSAPKDTCVLVSLAVVVNLDNDKTPESIAHVFEALQRGQPRILHIDREAADQHRKESLRGKPKQPGKDLDEYPPAFSREGGTGADVLAIPSSDNRSAGARMGAALRPFCDKQSFIVEP